MRADILYIIKCPYCNTEKPWFDLIVEEENEYEIRRGKVICSVCHSEFLIHDGILDLLIEPRPEVLSEQKGWISLSKADGSYEREAVEGLALKLPYLSKLSIIDRKYWASLVVNFEYAIKKLRLRKGERVLDLGAGRCWTTKMFAKRGCSAVALDILADKVIGLGVADKVITKQRCYFERVLGDMGKPPFKDKVFDLVFSAASVHHFSRLRRVISEASRVLKEGGKLCLINEPVVTKKDERLRELKIRETEFGISEHVYTLDDYLSSCRCASLNPKIYYPPGSLFEFEKMMHNAEGIRYLRERKIVAYSLYKLRLLNRGTTMLIWYLMPPLRSYYSLFVIAKKVS